jgi:hypothetical protein
VKPAQMMRIGALLERHDGEDRDHALRDFARRVLEARAGGRGLTAAVDAAGEELLGKLETKS